MKQQDVEETISTRNQGDNGGGENKGEQPGKISREEKKLRSFAEIFVFIAALLITLFLIGYSLVQAFSYQKETPRFTAEAQFDKMETQENVSVLPVRIINENSSTMEEIIMTVEIKKDDGTLEEKEIRVDYLPSRAEKITYIVSEEKLTPDTAKVSMESFKLPESRMLMKGKK